MNPIQSHRRKFLQKGLLGFCTALFAGLPKISLGKATSTVDKGFVVHQSEGTHILTRLKVPITIKISKARQGIDAVSFCIEEQIPGTKMRVHKHLDNDELIFIQQGEGVLTLGDEVINVKTGDVAFVPRGMWHGLDNTGQGNLLMAFQYTPAGFEEYFLENGSLVGEPTKNRTDEQRAASAKKFGMVYKDNPK